MAPLDKAFTFGVVQPRFAASQRVKLEVILFSNRCQKQVAGTLRGLWRSLQASAARLPRHSSKSLRLKVRDLQDVALLLAGVTASQFCGSFLSIYPSEVDLKW